MTLPPSAVLEDLNGLTIDTCNVNSNKKITFNIYFLNKKNFFLDLSLLFFKDPIFIENPYRFENLQTSYSNFIYKFFSQASPEKFL